jgi:hypothetical protein
MAAQIDTWYSIQWQIQDYSKSKGFVELIESPKFFYVDKYIPSLKLYLESRYPNLYIAKIFKTKIFLKGELPTHYEPVVFLPGDNPRYDSWLLGFHEGTPDLLKEIKNKQELNQAKIYLEYSNKILRHDLHSGINTYIPRGFKILQDRLPEAAIKQYKLELGMTLLDKGIQHAQSVYQGVQSFTSMVRDSERFETSSFDAKAALNEYLKHTSYYANVDLGDLGVTEANRSLFCMAINVFVKNGILFNKSKEKKIRVYREGETLCIEDNGEGLTQERFDIIVFPKDASDRAPGYDSMEMNISTMILKEHGMKITIHEKNPGTIIKIWNVFKKDVPKL